MLSLKRVADFWDGDELRYEPADDPWRPWMVALESAAALLGFAFAAARRVRDFGAIALMMLLYPLPYYLVYTNPRYRHALEPLMVVLMAGALAMAWEAVRGPVSEKNAEPAVAAN